VSSGLRASHHFGDGSLTHETAERPLTAKQGVEAYLDAPMASLVLHVNREALHHLTEVSLLRDLYWATGARGSPDGSISRNW
jgi:hypothetical protein